MTAAIITLAGNIQDRGSGAIFDVNFYDINLALAMTLIWTVTDTGEMPF